MKTVSHDGVRINYDIYGAGHPVLLFVHGSFNDQTYWQKQVEYFKKEYQVITMDLAGHGQSGLNRDTWTIEEFGEDVIELLKQLEFTSVILIGHSLGANAVLEAAVEFPDPVIGIIAVDNFKNAGMPLANEYQEQANQIIQNLKTDFANTSGDYAKMVLLTNKTPPVITEKVINAYRNADPKMGAKSIEAIFDYSARERELLQQLNFKLYLINVDYMPTNEETLKKYARQSYELNIIHGTSHFPMLENPDELNKSLEKIINEIKAGI
ncbi:alpha/beta fold hydrolase [Dyadobacter sp. NIV53]|uniref:alpha/beta fold hydrolase n=1 Tax=Dyadobacter sp. NIV53 TaxID=2861765 RepID=UPI001C8772F5|nr:alpha/beta hydrolase [Dyadobacter sp. NIV53]